MRIKIMANTVESHPHFRKGMNVPVPDAISQDDAIKLCEEGKAEASDDEMAKALADSREPPKRAPRRTAASRRKTATTGGAPETAG